jgi:hypothetical protein
MTDSPKSEIQKEIQKQKNKQAGGRDREEKKNKLVDS